MNAICPKCLRLVSWSGSRGSRLADVRCPDCGSPLQKAKYLGGDDTAYGTKDGRRGHYGKVAESHTPATRRE